MTEVYFILLTVWFYTGEVGALRSEPIYGPRAVCEKRLPLDIAVQRKAFAAVGGECVAAPPKPPGLSENQPYVPGKVSA